MSRTSIIFAFLARTIVLGSIAVAGALAATDTEPSSEAQTAEQTPEQETSATDEASTASTPEEEAQETVKGNKEVFIPTEEISEDFAVSFPVDI